MRLRHIEVFHAIYTTGSITNAAKLLYVSQPSVSKVLSHAEQQLGFDLFQRNKGKLIPTSEAKTLFPEIDKLYKQLRSINALAENINRRDSGVIDIALTPGLGFGVIPRSIAKFREVHPHVQFKLQTMHNDDALQTLLEHKCDLALLYSSPPLPGIEEVELGSSEVVILYPKQSFPADTKIVSVESLAEQELISIWDSGPLGDLVLGRFESLGMETHSNMQVDTYYIAASLVDKGMGCCTIDKLTAISNITDNVGVSPFNPPLDFKIKGLHLETRPLSRICEHFLDFVRAELNLVYNQQ
ncbi:MULTISPECIES: LysR family transcriptional regulator [Alteromonadaceae]|uniref:LysR family transcriptional regulator n=1 Tax=Alteromonadaceae TaxID=72275 RepID=UPI001C0A453F|nr:MULTISPECIES: LysR family transcriptional regulator [Aliiglaciecola]MBU2877540.1 LysR family transcriptional regulator [Aliiglaciecola lipolytica]MDO6711120.1 LysR family transcriptional regulator [Aliiglaciecola sp. 2_MG-2023]MDO6752034.1 LysR family transcriptional regulator [Aliiglaciecola sp. 1_MG-2023]